MLEVKEIPLAGHRSQGLMGFLDREAKGRFLLMKYGGGRHTPFGRVFLIRWMIEALEIPTLI